MKQGSAGGDPAAGMIGTLLVANRGEIARRIMRTAREMGITTVATYTDPDRDSPHVSDADVALRLGDGSPGMYLEAGAVVEAAHRAGAHAVHPGYGFGAENASFATAVIEGGLIWVGPPPAAIAAMGDKLAAKSLAAKAGMPTLASVELEGDDPRQWELSAAEIGYPLLVKAAAGGGGKGMQVVESPRDLPEVVASARRLAASAFGDPRVFAERLLRSPRHIEIQVLADRHGGAIHLGERECSIQRRHQKIVEEAPSAAVDASLRERMGAAAVALTTAIAYEGAGTIELLVEGSPGSQSDFWFLEMNTRLQVEHPVTEAVSGIDIVRAQIEIAQGLPLGLRQEDLRLSGHAIEARVYAEDPSRDFLPTHGTLHRWRVPTQVRCDSGVATGSRVTTHYDPLLAKVTAHAQSRAEAAARLRRALAGMQIHGVRTNRDLLVAILGEDDFGAGRTTTSYLELHPELLEAGPSERAVRHHLLAAALAGQARRREADLRWGFAPSGWRNVPGDPQRVSFRRGEQVHEVRYRMLEGTQFEPDDDRTGFWATVDGVTVTGGVRVSGERIEIEVQGRVLAHEVHTLGSTTWVDSPEGHTELVELPRFPDRLAGELAAGPLAPVPGTVVSVEVQEGDEVLAGQTLVVLEAMKMEHRVEAHGRALVEAVLVSTGDSVDAHQLLVRLKELGDG